MGSLCGDLVAINIGHVHKFSFHVLESALMMGENSQQTAEVDPPSTTVWVRHVDPEEMR